MSDIAYSEQQRLIGARALRVAEWLVQGLDPILGVSDPQGALRALLKQHNYHGDLLYAAYAFPDTLHFYAYVWKAVRPKAIQHSPLRLARVMMGAKFGAADALWMHWLGRPPANADEAAAVAVWENTYQALKSRLKQPDLPRPERRINPKDDVAQQCYSADAWFWAQAPLDSTPVAPAPAPAKLDIEAMLYAAFERGLRREKCRAPVSEVIARWSGEPKRLYALLQTFENPVVTAEHYGYRAAVWERALAGVCRAAELDAQTVLSVAPPPPPEIALGDDFDRAKERWITACALSLERYEAPVYSALELPLRPVQRAIEDLNALAESDAFLVVLEGSQSAKRLGALKRLTLQTQEAPVQVYRGARVIVIAPPASFPEAYSRLCALRMAIDETKASHLYMLTTDLQRALIEVLCALKREQAVWCESSYTEPLNTIRQRIASAMAKRRIERAQMGIAFKAYTGYQTLDSAILAGLPAAYVESAVCYRLVTAPQF